MNTTDSEHFKPLKETSEGFLQVLVKEFQLLKTKEGIQLQLKIDKNDLCITKSNGKLELDDKIDKGKRLVFEDKLQSVLNDENHLGYRFLCPETPLRFSKGGVLPVIKLDNKEYFCLFYRSIVPTGWNIANGASNNLPELLYPEKVVFREFSEEFLAIDPIKRNKRGHGKYTVYSYSEDDDIYSTGCQDLSIEEWSTKLNTKFNTKKDIKKLLPVKWIDGPDQIIVENNGKQHQTKGFFVSILPKDNAIEIDKVAIIRLNNNAVILDGELGVNPDNQRKNLLVNRPVGLFLVDKFIEQVQTTNFHFIPDLLFFSGKVMDPCDLEKIVDLHRNEIKKYIKSYDRKAFSRYDNEKNKFDLCPVTHSIIQKYSFWRNSQVNQQNEMELTEVQEGLKAEFQLFISYKSEDEQIAFWLWDYLTRKGIRVFCSGKTIPEMGESDYSRVIDLALEKSKILVILASDEKYFTSGWVDYEWKSFFNELRSGRKPGGKIFTFTKNVDLRNLPYGLRNTFQNIPLSDSMKDSFDNLYQYIEASFLKGKNTDE
jgi:hypothetical protein